VRTRQVHVDEARSVAVNKDLFTTSAMMTAGSKAK